MSKANPGSNVAPGIACRLNPGYELQAERSGLRLCQSVAR